MRYITAQITCGEYSGNILFILRIPLSPTDAGLPFTLRRRQTQRVGVLLDEPVLSAHCTSCHRVAVTQAISDLCTEPPDC